MLFLWLYQKEIFSKEIHQALQALKKLGPQPIIKKNKMVVMVVDRLKEIEFKKKSKNSII